MEELFRFVSLRAPNAIEPEVSAADRLESVTVEEGSSLEEALEGRVVVEKPEQGNTLLADLAERIAATTDETEPGSPHDLIAQVMGSSASDLVASEEWNDLKGRLEAGILKAKYFPSDPVPELHVLYQQRVGMSLIEATAADAGLGIEKAQQLSRQALLLPAIARVRKDEGEGEPPQDDRVDPETFVAELNERFTQLQALKETGDALLSVSSSDIKSDELQDVDGFPGTSKTATISARTDVFGRLTNWLVGVVEDPSDSAKFTARALPTVSVTDRGYDRLPEPVKSTLSSLHVDPREESIEEIHSLLLTRQLKLKEALRVTMKPLSAPTHTASGPLMMMAGSSAMAESSLSKSLMTTAMKGGYHLPFKFFFPEFGILGGMFCIPSRLNPAGVGQLLVVRQQLIGYKKGEISHVENVLAGETRVREHNRSITTETIFETEIETERTEERDLETTDRFQMSSETSSTIKEELEVKGEVKVSLRYGPTVKVDASTGVAWKQSKENANKRSVEYSKEVTEKSLNKLVERVREMRRKRIVEEVSEKNTHSFDNTGGEDAETPEDHIQGIYQWLDKVYQAQVYDYGLRTFYDLVIPEPAAFYIAAFQSENATPKPHLKKPVEFLVDPLDITETNYGDWVAEYGASDVVSPPEPYLTLSKTFTHERIGDWKKTRIPKEDTLEIADGYEAFTAWSTVLMTGSSSEGTAVDVTIGRSAARHSFNGAWTVSHSLGNETGSIPLALKTFKTEVLSVAIEVKCRRTSRAMNEWRLDTHEKLQTAYEKRLVDYNAELDKLSMLVEAEIRGGNPASNRKRAATEVKKAAIALIANQRILIDSINVDSDDIPYVDIHKARENDPLIRFLEQAFEWENMSFFYYPYFWGRKEPYWKQKIMFNDVDAEFADFIRAGAARVQLPVRPGFEEAVDHYTKTCEPWNGGELPSITDELYLPFVEEHKAQLGAPGDEVPVGDPWPVIVPTNLVYLKDSAELPRWEEVDDEWVDVSE